MLVGRGCSFCVQARNQLVQVFRQVVVPSRADVTNADRLREIPRARLPDPASSGKEAQHGKDA